MERDDVELIRSVLSGDDSAFSDLVDKYQKSVHALAWRKVEDFQVAEEIAQDAFLQAYKKLASLKDPNQFAGWLYVITSNLCHDWHRRKKPIMQSLDATNTMTLEKTSYERYLVELQEKKANEHRRELVKNLLAKLPESERTVVTLHYLGEMTSEAISKFLGVSVNTIKSRLRRARKRLKEETPMIRETLGSVQLPNNFTQNIMEQIENIEIPKSANPKPLVPWAAFCSAAVLVILLMGISNQFLTMFQKPYSLEAESATSIEIVDSHIILDIQAQPNTQKRIVNVAIANADDGLGENVSDLNLAMDRQEEASKNSVLSDKWTQTEGLGEGNVNEIFQTSDGDLIVVSPTGIYRMIEDESGWMLLNNTVPSETYSKMSMAEWNGILYLVSTKELYASQDRGVTWQSIGPRPIGSVIELLITNDAFYLVMKDEIFISTDVGKNWVVFNYGIQKREIATAVAIGSTILVGTDRGVYRLNSDTWEQLSVGRFRTIGSMAVAENTIYVVTAPDDTEYTQDELKTMFIREIMRNENSNRWEIYRSDNLGDSWRKITPKKRSIVDLLPGSNALGGRVLAVGETIIAFGMVNIYRSRDKGDTWTDLGSSVDSSAGRSSVFLAKNENTLYKESSYKLQRSTDGGESWQPFMKGIVGNQLNSLVQYNDHLYAHSGFEFFRSSDGGQTWTNVIDDAGNSRLFLFSPILVVDDILYAISRDVKNRWRIASISANNDMLVPIDDIPPISGYNPSKDVFSNAGESDISIIANKPAETEGLSDQVRYLKAMLNVITIGGIAVSDNTFYVDRDGRLYKTYIGHTEWIDTGFDTGKEFSFSRGNLAVNGETVYVSKADGQLFKSIDGGNNWIDITTDLPLEYEYIRDIVFVDTSVYVVTDIGVLYSQTGDMWKVLNDNTDSTIEIVSLAAEGTTIYGVNNSGIYYLDDQNEWVKISSEVPEHVSKLVIHQDRFYIATEKQGVFHIPIDKENR